MAAVEHFKNAETGIVWALNPGTPAYDRAVADADMQRVNPPKPARKNGKKADKKTGNGEQTADEQADDAPPAGEGEGDNGGKDGS